MKHVLIALLAFCLCLPLVGDDAAKKKFEEVKANKIETFNLENFNFKQIKSLRNTIGYPYDVEWDPARNKVALSHKNNISLWDIQSGNLKYNFKTGNSRGSISWSPDGKYLAASFRSAGDWTEVAIYNPSTGEVGYNNLLQSLGVNFCWSTDSSKLVMIQTASRAKKGRKMLLFDVTKNEVLHKFDNGENRISGYDSASMSPDGKYLAAVTETDQGTRAHVWDLSALKIVRKIKINYSLASSIIIKWSPDGKHIALNDESDDDHYVIKIINAATGEIVHTMKGHTYYVQALSWHPDSAKLVTGDSSWAYLWDIARGSLLKKFKYPRSSFSELEGITWSPNGDRLYAVARQDAGAFTEIWATETSAERTNQEKAMKEKAAVFKPEFEALKKKARNGDTRAMQQVSQIYLAGKNGIKKDLFMASLYYEASKLMINNGKIRGANEASAALIKIQLRDKLKPSQWRESQELAKTLVKEAEENWLKQDPTALNDPEQQKELAIRYLRGEGVQKNAKLALGLLLKSLPPKYDPNTLVIIGGMYDAEQFKDEAIEPSPANAMKYNLMAAYQNNAIAQRAIGDLYSKGIGVQKDLIKEYAWYSLSSNNGDEQGEQSRAAAQKELGFDDLLKAKAQANQIKAEIEKRMKEIADIRKAASDGLLKSIRNGDNQEKAKIFEKLSKDVEAVLSR